MSGRRKEYTPEFREHAARVVIETGRPTAHLAAEIESSSPIANAQPVPRPMPMLTSVAAPNQ
jgi:hypothetical protein